MHVCVSQWSSTWAKSPPRGRSYASLGRFCDLRDLGGNFRFQGGDNCSLSILNFWIDYKKNNICYFGVEAIDALSTPWFVIRAGLSKCGARLEAFLRGPIQCHLQKYLKRSTKSQW